MIDNNIFPQKLFKQASYIVECVQKKGFDIFFVGGSVRDAILGIIPNEIDMATNAKPEQIIDIFKEVDLVGKKYGVIGVLVDEFKFDIASFRKDGLYVDGRRPKNIEFTLSMEEDSNRRDFTMNALYYNPNTKQIFDYHDGSNDIKNKIIKTIGSAEFKLKEDGLRVLRAFKFKAKLGFKIDDDILEVIKNSKNLLSGISKKRISKELEDINKYDPTYTASVLYKLCKE